MTPTEPRGGEAITMQDVRLCAGEGKLSAHDVLNAVNAILRNRRPPVVHGWPDREAVARVIRSAIGETRVSQSQADWAAHRVLSLFPPVDWRGIETHDGSREPVLLIGLRRDGVAWTDVHQGFWQPPYEWRDEALRKSEPMPGSWARWPHPFPPTHFQPVTTPALPAAPLTDGVGE